MIFTLSISSTLGTDIENVGVLQVELGINPSLKVHVLFRLVSLTVWEL